VNDLNKKFEMLRLPSHCRDKVLKQECTVGEIIFHRKVLKISLLFLTQK
jgi:hypothetical protein